MPIQDKIVIGENWSKIWADNDRAMVMEARRAELRRFGIEVSHPFWSPYEIVKDENGKVFSRSLNTEGGHREGAYYKSEEKNEQMMCLCGSKAFEIRFNSSGVDTKCTQCGAEEEFGW